MHMTKSCSVNQGKKYDLLITIDIQIPGLWSPPLPKPGATDSSPAGSALGGLDQVTLVTRPALTLLHFRFALLLLKLSPDLSKSQ